MIADPNAPPALTAEALTYSASTRCRCGAGLAYPADRAQRSRESWVCSRVLLDNAPQAEHDSFPFAFYELKSEHTVSAYGATTRPPEAPRAAPRPKPPAPPTVAELAKIGFDAYGQATGGLTWDGKPIPPFEVVAERTPHVARAWEAAAVAILKARGVSA